MSTRETLRLDERLRILQLGLNVLEEKIRQYAPDEPADLLLERADVNEEIAQIKRKLEGLRSNPLPRSRQETWVLNIGAQHDASGTNFRVWAPDSQKVEVLIFPDDVSTETSVFTSHELRRQHDGYFKAHIRGVSPGQCYKYRLDSGHPLPDPVSRYQPQGVHGPSQIIDPTVFEWTDQDWRGVTLDDLIIYEIHVGTATREGTFDALITYLGALRDLGVTAIELMPVADFPGERNWGYDGVNLFAPSRAYGGPEGLRRLVNAAHARGIAVLLDAVFNHLGPDGNYLWQYSKDYFNPDYNTPWGPALNFDGIKSREVRELFVANACYWAHEFHIDGLRLDAVHAIHDSNEPHILAEIGRRVRASLPRNRSFLIIAEDDNNDPRLIQPEKLGGFDVDALWADDFHHQLRVALTGDQRSYYIDYEGTIEDIAKTLTHGWFYIEQYSQHRGRIVGKPTDGLHPARFVHCIENHDQIGNRPRGERLNLAVGHENYRLASTLLLLSPFTPLLFMGQEWASSTPFFYFTDHNTELGPLVTQGRQRDMSGLFPEAPLEDFPDPQDRRTFLTSKLRWEERAKAPHINILQLYRDLISLRSNSPALRTRARNMYTIETKGEHALVLRRRGPEPKDLLLIVVNLGGPLHLDLNTIETPLSGYEWALCLDTEASKYGGRGDSYFSKGIVRIFGTGVVVAQLTQTPIRKNSITNAKTVILFLASDPTNAARLRLGEELRAIQEALQLAKLRDRFDLYQRMSVRPVDVSQALLDIQPQVVHFSGHGTATGEICFENMAGETQVISSDALAALFEEFTDQVKCVVLNACFSETQASAIAQHINYVVGMNQELGDQAAIAFAIGFYQALGAGRTIDEAYKLGVVQIRLQGIPEHLTPVLLKKKDLQ